MKKSIYSLMWAFAAMLLPLFAACDQTDAERDRDATPSVEFVRVTNPDASDSLLTSAPMGQQIVIMGKNLGDVQKVFFNDVEALLNPTLITSYSIILDVPSVIPTDVTNTMTLITSKGTRAVHDFRVVVPAPSISAISCEYAKPGDVITLTGNYFLEPSVYFTGDAQPAEIVRFNQTSIDVVVPQNAAEGPVTVESIYGRGKTKFSFLDTNGLLTNFDDDYQQPWGRGTIASEGGISGNYLLFEAPTLSAWGWNESLMWGYWAYAEGAQGNAPIAQGDINSLALKFEADIETWVDCPMLIWFQSWSPNGAISPDDNYAQCHWKPWMQNGAKVDAATNGWKTFTIPLTEFRYNKEESLNNLSIGDITSFTDMNIMVFGACDQPAPFKIKMDNFRIVNIR